MRRSQTWKKAITYGDQAQWLVRMERCTFLEGNSYPSIEDAYAFYVHNRFYLITTDHLNHFYTSNNGHYENAGIVLWQSDDPHAFPVDQVVPAVKTISNYIDVTALSELKQYRGIKFERPQFLKNADGFPIRLYAPVGFNPVGGDGTVVYTMEVTE